MGQILKNILKTTNGVSIIICSICSIFSILGILSTYLAFIYHHDLVISYDWNYFNTLALFIKSSFLSYHKFPLQDPFVCGGMDVLSNPQNWIFSPLVLLTIIFPPYLSNILSLVFLSIFGLWGSYKFFKYHGVSFYIALGSSLLYVNCAWIGLHFIEGHIVYRTFLLFPYLIYLFYTSDHYRHFLILCLLEALILLDGGMYTFIFSSYLYLLLLIVDVRVRNALLNHLRNSKFEFVSSVFIFLSVSAIKWLPVLLSQNLVQVKAVLDFYTLNLNHITSIFFSMFKTNNSIVPYLGWRYHEFGCYIGPLMALTILYGFLSKKISIKDYCREIVITIFFFIVASGVGGDFNPWHLMQKIPLINKAHMQSRYFIVCFIFILLLFALVLQKIEIERKKLVFSLLIIINLEFIVARNIIAFDGFEHGYHKDYFNRLIDNTTISVTHQEVNKLHIYYNKNMSSKECYEPAKPRTSVAAIEDANNNYKGEVFLASAGAITSASNKGIFNLKKYIPGHIELDYKMDKEDTIIINTNMNNGWRLENQIDYHLINDNKTNLLKIATKKLEGSIILDYIPKYFYPLLLLYFIGLLSFLFGYIFFKRKNIHTDTNTDTNIDTNGDF